MYARTRLAPIYACTASHFAHLLRREAVDFHSHRDCNRRVSATKNYKVTRNGRVVICFTYGANARAAFGFPKRGDLAIGKRTALSYTAHYVKDSF